MVKVACPTFWYPTVKGLVGVATAYEGNARVACPDDDDVVAWMFQKLTGFQLVALRVRPTSLLFAHVVLTTRLYCVIVWPLDCQELTTD